MKEEMLRFSVAFLSGSILSLAGSFTQVATSNPVAGPATLGFNAIAVLFILIANFIVVNLESTLSLSFLSSCLFTAFVLIIWGKSLFNKNEIPVGNKFYTQTKSIIIIGLTVNLLVGAVFSFIQFLFMSLNLEFPTGLWFGNFKIVHQKEVAFLLVTYVLMLFSFMPHRKKISLFVLGPDFLLSHGINMRRFQKNILWMSFFGVGIVTCFYGVFSFMGLIFPHLLRNISFFRKSLFNELFYGPLLCGAFMMLLDMLCYHLPVYGVEVPVGMVSAILGSMLLIFLLYKNSIKIGK